MGKTKYLFYVPMVRDDGLGSHFLNQVLSALHMKIDYPSCNFHIHPRVSFLPDNKIDHNYGGFDTYSQDMHDFIGLWRLFPMLGVTTSEVELDMRFVPVMEYIMEHMRGTGDLGRYFKSNVFELIREYWRRDKIQWGDRVLGREAGRKEFHISMHVRRLNPCDDRVEGTDLPVGMLMPHLFECLVDVPSDVSVVLHVFSQGEASEFEVLERFLNCSVRLHLCEDVRDTFVGIAMADAAVLSTSGLGVAAGMMSKGKVCCTKGWHIALPWWKEFDVGLSRDTVAHTYDKSNDDKRKAAIERVIETRKDGESWKKMTDGSAGIGTGVAESVAEGIE